MLPFGPSTDSLPWLFALGFLLPMYTITGFDASAHTAEETVGAAHHVPRAIVRSVLVSGVLGWVMLAAVVLAIPNMNEAAAQGENAFHWIMGRVLPDWLSLVLVRGDRHRPIRVRTGDGDFRLAHDLRVCARRRIAMVPRAAPGQPSLSLAGDGNLGGRGTGDRLYDLYAGLLDDRDGLRHLSVPFLRPADAAGPDRLRPNVDSDGPLEPGSLVSRAGGDLPVGLRASCLSSAFSRPTTRRCGSCWALGG